MIHRDPRLWAVSLSILAISQTAGASGEPPDELGALYGGDQSITLATGYTRPLFDAPANATIVSRDQIERLGANNLAELLQTVSAYYLSSNDAYSTAITVRGITSRVLILVDGVPLYQGFVDATFSLRDVLLYNVERVEITRGPGSALYGADAVAGIVNLITRTDSANAPRELGAVGGNLDTGGGWGLYRASVGAADLRLYGAYVNGDYTDRILEADAQTALDRRFHTHDSLAPGPINDAHQLVDTRAELSLGSWTARVSYRDEFHGGDGVGLAFALDPAGRIGSGITSVELVHHSAPSPNWTLSGYLAYIDVTQDSNVTGYPAGAFGGAFPTGVRQILDVHETRVRGEVSGTYAGWSRQKLLLSAGGFTNSFNVDSDIRNYTVRAGRVLPTGVFAPFGGVGDTPLIGDTSDVVLYGVAQDEWTIARDWTFTAGARMDHYSDFGAQWTPRGVGLHPHTADDLQGALRRGLPTPCSARTGLQRHVRPSGRPQAQAYETTHGRTGCYLSTRTRADLAGSLHLWDSRSDRHPGRSRRADRRAIRECRQRSRMGRRGGRGMEGERGLANQSAIQL